MTFATTAARLLGCAVLLVPQIAIGNTSQTRLTIGATVVTPCRVSVDGAVACSNRDSEVTSRATKDGPALNPPAAQATKTGLSANSVKFVQVSF